MKLKRIPAALGLALTLPCWADQPIMNMMPRWSEGYGFQLIQEFRQESDLLQGDHVVAPGLGEEVHILNLEAVYTWERWIRLTAKLPYVLHAERELIDASGTVYKQTDSGWTDLTLALPLKQYFNLDGRSGSWTLAPQVRIPLAGDSDYEIGSGEWGLGLSAGYETETANWFISTGANLWTYAEDKPTQVGLHLDLGRNLFAFGSSGQLLWESDFQWEDDGSYLLKAGPALYWRVTDTVHCRLEWKRDFLDYTDKLDHGNGDTVKLGVGFVY